MPPSYNARQHKSLCFTSSAKAFNDGEDTSRAYLERCLETITVLEATVRGWAFLNIDGARAQADTSTRRWKAGRPLSPVDGMPIGIKDMLETMDMPTEMGVRGLAGNFPKRDNAAVWALRQAGATILGKTVTCEYGGVAPSVTTNPFDPAYTPGGSSAGSAAVIGANMVPAAVGSQVGGSMIRPASYCATYALKPSQGAINRGEGQSKSMLTHGPLAGSLEDMWAVAIEIARRAGGDPGHLALSGPKSLPGPHRPMRLAILETEGLAELEPASLSAFEAILSQLKTAGVEIVRRSEDPLLDDFEHTLAGVSKLNFAITAWENQWALRNILASNSDPDALSAFGKATLEAGERLGLDGYEHSLRQCVVIRDAFKAMDTRVDAFISPSSKGPAPRIDEGAAIRPDQGFPTGDPVFNTPSSLLGACAVTSPLTSVGSLPMGIQLMGHPGTDARMTAIAHWMRSVVTPVCV